MNPLAVLMPGFVGTELPDWLADRLRDGLGGVCLFVDNVESREQLRALTDAIYAANPHAVISMDEEGGDVTRIYQHEGSPFPGNAVLGRLDDVALTEAVGTQVGWELRATGVGLVLAPDVDVNSNPHNPVIGVRSFGAQPAQVARHAAAWTRGLESTGVASCAKHFPGHGDTAQDSHLALPVVDADLATLSGRELVPFRAAIDAGARTVMTSHIVVPALDPGVPATFSRRILQGVLRDEWGFAGVIVTDALDMAGASADRGIPAAAVLAVAAGADLLCIGTRNTDEQVRDIAAELDRAIAAGELGGWRLADAAGRVGALGAELAQQREQIGVPPTFAPARTPGVTTGVVLSSFHVAESARSTLARCAGRPLAYVALESAANIAVGTAPWGPFAAGIARTGTIGPDDDAAEVLAAISGDAVVALVGKDLHRHAFARAAVEAVRGRDAIVIDMGWPEPSFADVDVATFGASRLVGQALVELVGGDSCASE